MKLQDHCFQVLALQWPAATSAGLELCQRPLLKLRHFRRAHLRRHLWLGLHTALV